ncbi:MAG: hypothetical protein ACI9F9_000213 [Candidatus Paceibacteria bacterium]|jgi:hypothetical protein
MKLQIKTAKPVIVGALAFLAFASPLQALVVPEDDKDKDKDKEEEEEEEKEPVAEADKDQYFLVTNAEIHTGTGAVLRDASLLAKNGKVVEIGYDIEAPGRDFYTEIPEDEREFRLRSLDAQGMRVYPGIVAITSSGLAGASGDYRDSVDPFSQNMVLGLATGITTTGSGRAAIKLKRYVSYDEPLPYDFDGVVLSDSTHQSMSYSSAATKRALREKLVKARDYVLAYRQWEIDVKADKELTEPNKKGVDGTTLAILRGEATAHFRADDRAQLLGIARLAQEFGFRPLIDGCREGWTVAEELGRAGASAIVTARDRRDKDERLVSDGGSSIENAAILTRAGVSVAIVPSSKGISLGGIAGRDIMHLPVEVGFAIRGGLSEELAMASITTVPARMMGISDRVGTLEVGKDCDLIVTDGDLLHYQTFVQYTVVDGQLVYDKEEELFFAHIRPRPEQAVAPDEALDAGENPEVAEEKPVDEEESAGDKDDK